MPRAGKSSKQKQQKGIVIFNVKRNDETNPIDGPPSPPQKPTNKPTTLGNKSDEEIVYSSNYPFVIDIPFMLMNPPKERKKAPRPQNSFFLYRRDMSARYRTKHAEQKLKSKEISAIIADKWNNETAEVKELFRALARLADKRHSEMYQNYQFSPKKSKEKRQNKNDPELNTESYPSYPSTPTSNSSNFDSEDAAPNSPSNSSNYDTASITDTDVFELEYFANMPIEFLNECNPDNTFQINPDIMANLSLQAAMQSMESYHINMALYEFYHNMTNEIVQGVPANLFTDSFNEEYFIEKSANTAESAESADDDYFKAV